MNHWGSDSLLFFLFSYFLKTVLLNTIKIIILIDNYFYFRPDGVVWITRRTADPIPRVQIPVGALYNFLNSVILC